MYIILSSFNDILSDTKLADNYLQWTEKVKCVNDTSVQTDIFRRSFHDDEFTFTCSEFKHPWYGILTLVCIYLPSAQVISALYGPQLGGTLGFLWGLFVMVPLGAIIGGVIASLYNSAELFVFGFFLFFLGIGTVFIGNKQFKPNFTIICSSKDNVCKTLLYPVLVALAPLIFIVMKFLLMARNSKLIQNMVKVATVGEVVYESAPQLALQLYILLKRLESDGWTWFSITTSSMSLIFSLVHSQYIENLPEDSWRDYVKSAIVILLNSIYRVLSFRYISPLSS